MRNLVTVYRNSGVEHYSIDADGDLVRGVSGYTEWDGDVPAGGWEKVARPTSRDACAARARLEYDALRVLLP